MFSATLDPNRGATDVVLEWGADGAFDHQVPVESGVEAPGTVSVRTSEAPTDSAFCARFSARNANGTATLPVTCTDALPRRSVAPGSPGAS